MRAFVWQAILPAGGLSGRRAGWKARLQPGLAATQQHCGSTQFPRPPNLQGRLQEFGVSALQTESLRDVGCCEIRSLGHSKPRPQEAVSGKLTAQGYSLTASSLFVPQCLHGIDRHGVQSWFRRGHKRHGQQRDWSRDHRQWVAGRYPEQQARQVTGKRER